MSRILYSLLIFFWVFRFSSVYGQSIAVGSITESPARALQLYGKLDSSISFCVRPFTDLYLSSSDSNVSSGNTNNALITYRRSYRYLKGHGKVVVLPFTLTQQFNAHHPYGWNDGGMIAANGYQTLASMGVYASAGPLEIQLQPEFVYAANSAYDTTAAYGSYGKSYQKLFPGQSSVRLSAFSLSIGLSTENLWWGPGIRSSLLMSNNAPGFLHGFFRSQKPIRSGIGSFEWQLIGGRLINDPALPYENRELKNKSFPEAERYLSAFVLSYQPKWVPGLFVGMTRAIQRYRSDVNKSGAGFLNKYIPVLFKAFDKQNAASDDTMRTDQLASFFLRWALLRAKAEFYFEYGLNDYNYNTRDYVMSPTHSAAFIAGAKKVFPLANDSYVDCGIEITQMSESPDRIVRPAGNWYEHSLIMEGYTHQNQILGAGAGFGANVQTLSAAWVKGNKRLGILFERVNRNPDLYTYRWVDVGVGLLPQWDFGHLIVSAKFQFINSSQYAWQQNINKFNFHTRIGLQYQL
jgi:hypothetical protein